MQRLSGLDASFLALETPTSHMHVAALLLVDPSTVPGGLDFGTVRKFVASRLHTAAPFRRRLVTVPFGVHHPMWVQTEVDIEQHVHRVTVNAPGDQRELASLVGDLAARQLDRRKPLWELWVIEGLAGGRMALLAKVHHAAVDGIGANDILVSMLQLSPDEPAPPVDDEWEPEQPPPAPVRLAAAGAALVANPARLVSVARRTAGAALRVRRQQQDVASDHPGVPRAGVFAAPRTSFSVPITERRAFAFRQLPMDKARAVKRANGVTINDVVLAMCGGALRHYLAARDQLPDTPVVAMVPVSVRTDRVDPGGNRITSTVTSLGSHIEDPLERLQTVHEAMQSAKARLRLVGADALRNWAEFASPAVFAAATRLYSRYHLADHHRPLFNLTMSNVPGPDFRLYTAGALIEGIFPLGPIYDGAGVNISVMSYQGVFDVGINVCPDVFEDPWELADAMIIELDALHKASRKRPAARRSRSRAAG
jgi:WS/DGAT/MGAT family acyltransferase